METLTAEQFKSKYGETGVNRFSAGVPDASTFTGTQDRLADVGQSTAGTISQAISGEGQFEGQSPLSRGVQATASAFTSVPRGALAMAPEPVRTGVEKAGEFISKGFGKVTGAIAETELFKEIGELEAQGLISPENTPEFFKLKETLGTTAAAGEITGTIAGAAGVVGTARGLSNVAKQGLKASDDVLTKVRAKTPVVIDGNFFSKAVNDARFKISDIDPQAETVLKRSNFDEVNTYFQQAKNAKIDPKKSTPLEIAGNKAESAYDAINDARFKAIDGKKSILAQVADEKVPGNTINEVMSTSIQRMNEKFGTKIDANGKITQAQGRNLTIDATDQKLISEYVSRLNKLGVAPTLKEVDDFVDWAQGQLYKQSKTISKLDVASDPVIRELQKTTGDLNGRLKDTVGGGYGEVNARISNLIELQDELSRALGADARKGGGLMKTLFSPTGGNTRRIFADIQKETGVDLFKEATLAKYAMETVGDPRQASLLKQLDVATQAAAELDLTKPMSLVRWLKERGDLDGQQLANEIIKREGKTTTGAVKSLTPEETKVLNRIEGGQGVSSANNTPDLLKNNSQSGRLTGSGGGISQIKAVESAIDKIEVRLKRFDNDGMSTNNQQYKNSIKERDVLYQILGKLF